MKQIGHTYDVFRISFMKSKAKKNDKERSNDAQGNSVKYDVDTDKRKNLIRKASEISVLISREKDLGEHFHAQIDDVQCFRGNQKKRLDVSYINMFHLILFKTLMSYLDAYIGEMRKT